MSSHQSIFTKPQNNSTKEIQVFTLVGRQVFRTNGVPNGFVWHGLDQHGHPVANGVYLAVITTRHPDGTILTREIKKLIVKR